MKLIRKMLIHLKGLNDFSPDTFCLSFKCFSLNYNEFNKSQKSDACRKHSNHNNSYREA